MKRSLSPGTRGSIAELRVSAHLLSLGFDGVFRNLSVNGPCDLVATRSRRLIRVQVKSTLSLNQFENMRQANCELLAVLVDGEIRYRALNRAIQRLVPGSILARRPKRNATKPATKTATRKKDL
jgi:Holliday junction resolvase-like predicted endonuclease